MVKTKDAVNDMTVGTPAKLIIQFMIPVFLGNIFQQFYNIADSIVAGQFIGVKALAAIGSTGSLMFFHSGSVQNNMIKCGITWRCRFIWQADVPFL